MNRGWLLLLAAASCYSPPAALPLQLQAATNPHVTSAPLSEDAAVALAMTQSPVLQIETATLAEAEAGISAAGQLSNPALRFGHRSDAESIAPDQRWTLGLRIATDSPFALRARVMGARAAAAAQRERVAAEKQVVAGYVREQYALLRWQRAKRDLLTQQRELLLRQRDLLTAQLAAQLALPAAVAAVEQDLQRQQEQAFECDAELSQLQSDLALALGIAPHADVTFETAASSTVALVADLPSAASQSEAAVAQLLNSPQLRELAYLEQAADAEVAEEKAKRIPWFDWVQAERVFRDTTDQWAIGVSVTLPLFSWNRGEIAVKQAAKRKVTLQRQHVAQQMVTALANAQAGVKRQAARLATVTDELGASAAQLDRQIANLANNPAADRNLELTLRLRKLVVARTLLDAQAQYAIAVYRLRALLPTAAGAIHGD